MYSCKHNKTTSMHSENKIKHVYCIKFKIKFLEFSTRPDSTGRNLLKNLDPTRSDPTRPAGRPDPWISLHWLPWNLMVGGVIGVTKRVSIKQWSVTSGGDWLTGDTLGWTRLRALDDTTLMTEFQLRSVDKLWRHNYLSASSVNASTALIRWSSTVRIICHTVINCMSEQSGYCSYYLRQEGYVLPGVCLSVCLSVWLSVSYFT